MVLNIIGLGLWDEKDVTVKGLEAIKSSEYVYLEFYTSKLSKPTSELEKFYGKEIIIADRNLVESQADEMLDKALETDVSFLVIGDPFCATTHVDLRLRAKKKGVEVRIMNNASIINSVGVVGVDLYKYGRIVSIPFYNENVTSPYDMIKKNMDMQLSSLVLFDLDPMNDKFMTINEAAEYLLRVGMDEEQLVIGCAGIGSPKPEIVPRKLKEIKDCEFTLFPQCMIVPGSMHFIEEEALQELYD